MTCDYVGTKQVTAWAEEKDGAAGYAVKYADGYISWSPKDVFEGAYINIGHVGHLSQHQQRVIAEKCALEAKAKALSEFIGNNLVFLTLDPEEQERLKVQNDIMWQYFEILERRIAAF